MTVIRLQRRDGHWSAFRVITDVIERHGGERFAGRVEIAELIGGSWLVGDLSIHDPELWFSLKVQQFSRLKRKAIYRYEN